MLDQLIAYENGELNSHDTLELFSELIRSGQAWKLQGHYGRMAHHLIENRYIAPDGVILATDI
jgi:hypothetical protein